MSEILIIEDEKSISELIKINLELAGFKTLTAYTGKEALAALKTNNPDLILLDIILPEIDGFELLPAISSKGIPIIILTSKDNIKDKIYGLEKGADDYITKPFEITELIARVKAVLRRSGKGEKSFSFDNIDVDFDSRKVYCNGEDVELTLKEFDLLKCLIESRNIALSRERLLETIWGYDLDIMTRTLDIHIQKLRNKLKTDRIKTVYKIGYRLELE